MKAKAIFEMLCLENITLDILHQFFYLGYPTTALGNAMVFSVGLCTKVLFFLFEVKKEQI